MAHLFLAGMWLSGIDNSVFVIYYRDLPRLPRLAYQGPICLN